MKCLIVYHSKYGQTKKICARLADTLAKNSIPVDQLESTRIDQIHSLTQYDAVILGAPIYVTRHAEVLADFVRNHATELGGQSEKTTAFFSVSLSAAGTDEQQNDARKCMDKFLDQCRWTPSLKTIFAGGLPYRSYGLLTRWLMKRIARKAGGDTDTSQNHVYTDWSKVERFANQIATLCKEAKSA